MDILYNISLLFLTILITPLIFFVAALVFLFSGAPVIFKQNRIGKDGKVFTIYKFRTMKPDSEDQRKHLAKKNEADGPVFKIKNDPRFTQIGKFLAHTGLDELPQLWNVLKGDMALIGPRPLPELEAKKLTAWQKKRHAIKPGIISPWILQGYHTMRFDAWMNSDIAYIKQKSFWYDSKLAIQTICLLLSMLVRELSTSGFH